MLYSFDKHVMSIIVNSLIFDKVKPKYKPEIKPIEDIYGSGVYQIYKESHVSTDII